MAVVLLVYILALASVRKGLVSIANLYWAVKFLTILKFKFSLIVLSQKYANVRERSFPLQTTSLGLVAVVAKRMDYLEIGRKS